ncbi:PD-(D/E)XK nuclease family transposase [uncultured Dubosiella sp.]|uniref:PD-(D/E)XK nuclease family transposase n=1 Tax=uncultured Dubosiella sp. TaxID=1937011 RepID=UPI0026E9B1C1|nr:PD-(D/E)XK nuclease family transposase [uncultured Dubosiella sp.]
MKHDKSSETNEEYYPMIERFTLFSDFFMFEAFSRSEEAVELVARIVTGKKDLKVARYGMEVKRGFPLFRHVRYDLFIEDTENNIYDIEIENEGRSLNERAIVYSSTLIAQRMKTNEKFESLKDTWVIFLTKKDMEKGYEPYYDYKWLDPKGQRLLSRKAAIRFVNGQYRNDDAFGKLMHDFHCTDPDQMYYDELREIVRYLKKDPEGVKIMCDIMNEAERRWKEQARREGLAEGRAEGRTEERENMMRKLHAKGMSFEEIASITELPLSTIKTFFRKQSKAV